MTNLASNLEVLKKKLEHFTAEIVVVTKTHPLGTLKETYDLGLRVFGENKVQELQSKFEALPKDIQWHMIGHLQSNKVKYIAPFISLIHSVDSLGLLTEINRQGEKNNRIIPCLLQVHIAKEETKYGFTFQEVIDLVASDLVKRMEHITIKGLMGMATNSDDEEVVRSEFRGLRNFFENQKSGLPNNCDWTILSMGMSGDYSIALEEGSTMIRIGSALFGARNYSH